MAQNEITFPESSSNIITYSNIQCLTAAKILKENLDKISLASFEISSNKTENGIILEVFQSKEGDYFEVNSDNKKITLRATSDLFLEYAVYSLLEYWEVRKFTPDYTYYPKFDVLKFPANKNRKEKPSFNFRGLLYPGMYDEAFRKWHKIDWYLDDFGLWGHTFNQLLPAKEYFKENPKMFALYDHKRHGESICYSNDTVFKIMVNNITKAIKEKPYATYFSVSQNDDVVYCECSDCQKLNQKYGSPQGAHYYFLNQIAKQFPQTKIATLAYLFSYQPPKNLKLATNLYPIVCAIEANRGEALNEGKNISIKNTLQKWTHVSKNVMFWDYTVEFSNFLSPFPNLHTFSPNYSFLNSIGVKGIFSQGYADIPGSFSELRQYLLAKLLWNSNFEVKKATSDFLRGYYGKSAPYIQEYLDILTKNQIETKSYLDIYSGPVEQRNTFLSAENMSIYDNLIAKANAENDDPVIKKRILKLRLDLEYVYFEQAKFYGKEPHGMYQKKGNSFSVKDNLENRVQDFVKNCSDFGIYELSEDGLSPEEYFNQWKYIARNNVVDHLGENLKYEFQTQPSSDFNAKKERGLNDGIKGYKDFNLNWTGWYGQNAEIIITSNNVDFNSIDFQCLEDQRHWIFLPKEIILKGFRNQKWEIIKEQKSTQLTENYNFSIGNYSFDNIPFRIFDKIKIILIPEQKLPIWRERKNKKPMLMLDEIVLKQK
ncbi:DUF4838 domain-containing protein [Flavobacterium sp. W22_SRS_FK3]|uniref:DUF4838 domain-containing protein n=1 Tax=Flavobacterium sp. W22_SRS_FK3 TaxID=3240275 RepID=UPI003F8E34B3